MSSREPLFVAMFPSTVVCNVFNGGVLRIYTGVGQCLCWSYTYCCMEGDRLIATEQVWDSVVSTSAPLHTYIHALCNWLPCCAMSSLAVNIMYVQQCVTRPLLAPFGSLWASGQ